jgi:hypothetical protein
MVANMVEDRGDRSYYILERCLGGQKGQRDLDCGLVHSELAAENSEGGELSQVAHIDIDLAVQRYMGDAHITDSRTVS